MAESDTQPPKAPVVVGENSRMASEGQTDSLQAEAHEVDTYQYALRNAHAVRRVNRRLTLI
jgi:hypothetical protein